MDDLIFINPDLHKKVHPSTHESNPVGHPKAGWLFAIFLPMKIWEGHLLLQSSFSPAYQKTSHMLSGLVYQIRCIYSVRAVMMM